MCVDFAESLMEMHGFGKDGSATEFSNVSLHADYPDWFTPNEIKNGIVLSGGDFAEAYIDKDKGRLYFMIWH